MDIGYYPGCALHGTSNDYEQSARACLEALGVGLKEVNDWICCGATAAHSINHRLSVALPARRLLISATPRSRSSTRRHGSGASGGGRALGLLP